MNRIERISAILIQLQSKKIVRGEDIAKRFNISLRTAYRDIRALEATGVPITGEAGLGYSLVEGYRLPPVTLTREEALSFLTAEKMVKHFTDGETSRIYESALTKIKSVLRSEDKAHLEKMDHHIEVIGNPWLPSALNTGDHTQLILAGIASKKVLNILYFSNHSQQQAEREVEPVGIFMTGRQWHLIAYCRLRKAYRDFRLDRIRRCQATDLDFRQEHPSLQHFVKDITKEKKEMQEVVILVDKNAMRYFGEQKYYNGFVSEKILGEQVEMTFLTCSITGFARWYMMFGDVAQIKQPKSLRNEVKRLSGQVLKKLKS